MKVERELLLKTLTIAAVGLTKKEILEQSHSFVFTEEYLVTFNGEILTRTKNPVPDVLGAIPGEDLLQMLTKFPDDEVELIIKGEELRIKGNRRTAGITRAAEVQLPYEDVPTGKEWQELPAALMGTLLQASRVCGKDETQPRTTEVHVTENEVEACDNFRLFRSTMQTGLQELLIPAASLDAIGGLTFQEVSVTGGWIHFKAKGGHRVSLRCSSGIYPDLGPLLVLEAPQKVALPGNLVDIISRAEVMHDTSYDASVDISLAEGELILRARKETGWYRESRKVEYSGAPLRFTVHPKFLEEILTKTRNVRIGGNRMRIKSGETIFIVCLEIRGEEE